jgi:hypothetical protein
MPLISLLSRSHRGRIQRRLASDEEENAEVHVTPETSPGIVPLLRFGLSALSFFSRTA